jgi:hypothetical protein
MMNTTRVRLNAGTSLRKLLARRVSAVEALRIAAEVCETNAPINDRRGDADQAALERQNSAEYREAIDVLSRDGAPAIKGKELPPDAAAHQAATSDLNLLRKPTQAQIDAGNYAKGHTRIAGMRLTIESPAGSYRRPEWPPMRAHYGDVKGTEGHDGDPVDVFIQVGTPSDWCGTVYVIDQPKRGGSGFDEHKVMLGFDDQRSAVQCYLAHYPAGWTLGPVTALPVERFKDWLRTGDTKAPMATHGKIGLRLMRLMQRRNGGELGKRVRLRPGVVLGLLLKYSPDQPRDERGRWSGGGGSGGGNEASDSITGEQVLGPELLAEVQATIASNVLEERDENVPHLSDAQRSQAREDLAGSLAAAAEAKPLFDERLTSIAGAVDGDVKLAGIKGGERLLEKHVLENGSDPTLMRDLVRGSVIVESPTDAQRVRAEIERQFDVVRVKDRFAEPLPTGYSDMLINVRMPNGSYAEIQVHIPEMIAAKSIGHSLYEIERRLPTGHPQKDPLVRLQSRVYRSAITANTTRRTTRKPPAQI